MGIKQWHIPSVDAKKVDRLVRETGQSALTCRILAGRGMETAQAIDQFISTRAVMQDPMDLVDMDKAVTRIRHALEDGERICIYGDYDCDGLTATALLTSYLQSVGADVIYYIPNREREGYGLNTAAVDLLAGQKVSLIVTVDNGIAGHEEIAYAAAQYGIDVVVTDHHVPRDTLPPAVAVVNPHRVDCPCMYKDLAGVGVAFKLVCALEEAQSEELLEYYADLAALGTVADVVPLTGENRVIVQHGLERLQDTDKIGLIELMRVSGKSENTLSSEALAFGMIPRINAAGRIGTADDVVELLLTESQEEAAELAERLDQLNAERKKIEADILAEIERRLLEDPQMASERLLLISGENWCHGIVGIVAARLAERYEKPCIVFSVGDGEARGSGRSVEGFSLIEAIMDCAEHLTRYGGHALAAGMTVPQEHLEAFKRQLLEYAGANYPVMPVPALHADVSLSPGELNIRQIESLAVLEPYGAANEAPLFHLPGMLLEDARATSDGRHIRLRLSGGGNYFSAVWFGAGQRAFPYAVGQRVDLLARIRVGEYHGKPQLSVRVVDLRAAGLPQQDVLLERAYYIRLMRGEGLSGEMAGRLLPQREDIALVYRYLRKVGRFPFDADALYERLFSTGIRYGCVRTAVDVLLEMGLIRKNGGGLAVIPDVPKVDLAHSTILINLTKLALETEVSV